MRLRFVPRTLYWRAKSNTLPPTLRANRYQVVRNLAYSANAHNRRPPTRTIRVPKMRNQANSTNRVPRSAKDAQPSLQRAPSLQHQSSTSECPKMRSLAYSTNRVPTNPLRATAPIEYQRNPLRATAPIEYQRNPLRASLAYRRTGVTCRPPPAPGGARAAPCANMQAEDRFRALSVTTLSKHTTIQYR